jgi:hypothetical protein
MLLVEHSYREGSFPATLRWVRFVPFSANLPLVNIIDDQASSIKSEKTKKRALEGDHGRKYFDFKGKVEEADFGI